MQLLPGPEHLKDFIADADPFDIHTIQKEIGEYSTSFKIKNKINELKFSWLELENCDAGIVSAISRTGEEILLFDQAQHGYNALTGLSSVAENTVNKVRNIDALTEVIISFQYSGEENTYADEGENKLPENYFDWIFIFLKRENKLEMIFDYECA